MNHKKILLSMLLILSILLVGCNIAPSSKDIYDKNDQIALQGDSFTYKVRIANVFDQQADIEFKNFTGAETLFKIRSGNLLKVDLSKEISSGRFKVVLIDDENEIIELEDEMEVELTNLIYRIKIVGDDASGKFELTLNITSS